MVDAAVHVIDRGALWCDQNSLVEGHTRATHREQNPDLTYRALPVYSFVIEHPAGTILWDTGIHHEAAAGHWPAELHNAFRPRDPSAHRLDNDLTAAGFGIDDIDAVFQSHLHLDHAGGLSFFAGTDTPVYAHKRELQFAYYDAAVGADDGGYLRGDFDHDIHWVPLVNDRETHFRDLTFIRLPGHTPGLTGSVLKLEDETLIFAGDQAYLAANYEEGVPPGGDLLWSKPAWKDSLRQLQALERTHDATVVYGHDPDVIEQIQSIEGGYVHRRER